MKHLSALTPVLHDSRYSVSSNTYGRYGCRCEGCTRENAIACRNYQRSWRGREYKREYRKALNLCR